MDDEPNPYVAPNAPIGNPLVPTGEPTEWKRWWDKNDWWVILVGILVGLPLVIIPLAILMEQL